MYVTYANLSGRSVQRRTIRALVCGSLGRKEVRNLLGITDAFPDDYRASDDDADDLQTHSNNNQLVDSSAAASSF